MTTTSAGWPWRQSASTFGTFGSPWLASSTMTASSLQSTATGDVIASDTSTPPTGASIRASSTATAQGSGTSSSSSLSAGQIIGITIGVVIAACLLIGAVCFFCWKRRKASLARRRTEKSQKALLAIKPGPHAPPRPNPPPPTQRPGERRPSGWLRYVNPAEMGLSIPPAEQQGFMKKWTNSKSSPKSKSKSKSMSTLPISAPIMKRRVSIQPFFRDRFFSDQRPARTGNEGPTKHVSNTTTIRTSCNPSTPGNPPIAVARPWSAATSAATTFEEDREFKPMEIPPLPTFTAIELSLPHFQKSTDKLTRIDIEAGIKKSIDKATSRTPMTPMYDNGNFDFFGKSRAPSVTKGRLGTSKSVIPIIQRTHDVMDDPVTRPKTSPTSEAYPSAPSPDALEPDNSLQSFDLSRDEDRLLPDKTRKDKVARSDKGKGLLPSPLTLKRSGEKLMISPLKNLEYPRIPPSTAEPQYTQVSPRLQPLLAPRPKLTSSTSADSIARYSQRPLPPVVGFENQPGSTVAPYISSAHNNTRIAHESPMMSSVPVTKPLGKSKSTSRARTQPSFSRNPAGQGLVQIRPSNKHIQQPKAIFTPNRTNTGDLVLTVDM